MARPKFDYYEKVRIASPDAASSGVLGELGAVLGLSQNEDGDWQYSVHLYSEGTCFFFSEDELDSTGEFAQRSDFYDGSSVRVSVDQGGRGDLANCEEEHKGGEKERKRGRE